MLLLSIKTMDGREISKVQQQQQLQHFGEQEQYTSSYFSYPSFSLFSPNHHTHFSKQCNELNNARAEADIGSSISFTPSEEDSSSGYSNVSGDHSCAELESDSSIEAGGVDVLDEQVSLNELLLDGKTRKKIELLAAMVGVDTTEPAIVLTEVVRVLKVLKAISQY